MSEATPSPPAVPGSALARFARTYRAYLIIPLILVLLLAAVMILGSRQAPPFIYTQF